MKWLPLSLTALAAACTEPGLMIELRAGELPAAPLDHLVVRITDARQRQSEHQLPLDGDATWPHTFAITGEPIHGALDLLIEARTAEGTAVAEASGRTEGVDATLWLEPTALLADARPGARLSGAEDATGAQLASLADGRLVVVYVTGAELNLRLLDRFGRPDRAPEVLAAVNPGVRPALRCRETRCLVAWEEAGAITTRAVTIDDQGELLAGAATALTTTGGRFPAIGAHPDRWLVAWLTEDPSAYADAILLQSLDESAAASTAPLRQPLGRNQRAVALDLAPLGNAGHVLVSQLADRIGLRLRTAAGTAIETNGLLQPPGDKRHPRVVSSAQGFAIVWLQRQASGDEAPFLARYDQDGVERGQATLAASGPGHQGVCAAARADGTLAVAWTRGDPASGFAIWLAIYGPDGALRRSPVQLDRLPATGGAALTATGDQFAVAWSDPDGLRVRRLTALP
jgi:hypothetical protein